MSRDLRFMSAKGGNEVSICNLYNESINRVSCINTFGDGKLPEGVTEDMLEEWILGCDNCQDCCPFNKNHDWV